MVEIWLIFNLFIPFAEVLLHTYMDTLRWDPLSFDFCCRVEEGSKSRQEEGDIKEKLLHSKMDKDLVSRNEKVQVQVYNLLVFQHFTNIFPTWILRLCASVTRMSK